MNLLIAVKTKIKRICYESLRINVITQITLIYFELLINQNRNNNDDLEVKTNIKYRFCVNELTLRLITILKQNTSMKVLIKPFKKACGS